MPTTTTQQQLQRHDSHFKAQQMAIATTALGVLVQYFGCKTFARLHIRRVLYFSHKNAGHIPGIHCIREYDMIHVVCHPAAVKFKYHLLRVFAFPFIPTRTDQICKISVLI